MVLTPPLDRKACAPCARAKRKCGKEIPRCRRCEEKGIECTYPSKRPASFVIFRPEKTCPSVTNTPSLLNGVVSVSRIDISKPSTKNESSPTARTVVPVPFPFDVPLSTHDIWFLSPTTWERQHILNLDISQFSGPVLKRYPGDIHRWLVQWVKEGTNPFIHQQLYRQRFPRCAQDAYTALSFFISKTPANEETAYQILQDRADQLLQDTHAAQKLNTFDHIARVHSLLVYQFLGLFESDIRLRHLAEERIPLLFKWANDMLESASQVANLSSFLQQMIGLPENNLKAPITSYKALPQAVGDEALWRAWILAECVRRTWAIATGIQTVYLTLQRGWSDCQGGTMLTTRKGVWAAESAYEWSRLCSEVDVGFMHREQTERLFTDTNVEDIDEFGKLMMKVTFGLERMERWGMDIRDKACE